MSKEILNKYIELIDKGYCDDCNELNCLGNFPHKDIAKNIKVILEENQELKNQQKEFIEYLNRMFNYYQKEEQKYRTLSNRAMKVAFESVLEKYKEIIGEHE